MSDDDYELAPEAEPASPPPHRTQTVGNLAAATSAGGYARGRMLIVKDGAVLPDRCIKCNAPAASGRVTKTLSYDYPANRSAAGSFLPYIGVIFTVIWLVSKLSQPRYHITVSYCMCPRHRAMRGIWILLAAAGMLGGVAMIWAAFSTKNTTLGIAGMWVFVAGALCIAGANRLYIATPTRGGAELRGAGRKFLASLPSPASQRFVP
jgi:hypothetical protein